MRNMKMERVVRKQFLLFQKRQNEGLNLYNSIEILEEENNATAIIITTAITIIQW